MLAGSVSLALVDRVTCPVAVVRGPAPQVPPPRSGPVVVGVDGSRAGHAALELAAGLAVSLGARLVAVHTWADVVVGIDGGARRRPEDPAFLAAEGAALLEAEDAVAASYTSLPVERDLVDDTPVRALLDRARGARLLVVGHRGQGHGSGSGMLLGSTSRALVESGGVGGWRLLRTRLGRHRHTRPPHGEVRDCRVGDYVIVKPSR